MTPAQRIGIPTLLASLACQAGDAPARPFGTEIRDSAGIRIVENPRPVEGSRLGWRVGPEPTLTIGTVDGEAPYIFNFVRGATRLSDGRIAVADYGPMEVRIFDGATGAHLSTLGGVGEGPGEYGDLVDVERLPGDSILTWGFPLKLSVFGPGGSFARSSRMHRQAETTVGPRPVTPVAAMDDGSILAAVQLWPLERAGAG